MLSRMDADHRQLRRLLVLNPKGGSGKSTLATNLAAWCAQQGHAPALLDMDPQGSSSRWLSKRGAEAAKVHGLRSYDLPSNVTRSFAMRPPPGTGRLVVDTPAAVPKEELRELTRDAARIIVPVLPSDIDIHAVTRCIADLLLVAKIPRGAGRIGIVANRVKPNTLVFRSLMRFLATLEIPVVGVLRDTQNYVRAFDQGLGIHELRGGTEQKDIAQWAPLLDWVEHGRIPEQALTWEQPSVPCVLK